MAQKRMFDRGIVSTDAFMEMSSDAQSLYFHLGIQADDEGFVSPKGIMRMISAPEDALRILIAKNFVIPFQSGVVVITDWHENNFLDSRRIKPTQHIKERSEVTLTQNKRYELSTCLASAPHPLNQYSIEESSIEENRIEENKREELTPSQEATSFFNGKEIYKILLHEFSKNGDPGTIEEEFKKFSLYWTERNKSGTKQRWQQQETFEVKRRLYTWLSRSTGFMTREKKITKHIIAK